MMTEGASPRIGYAAREDTPLTNQGKAAVWFFQETREEPVVET